MLSPAEVMVTVARFEQVRVHLRELAKNTVKLHNLKAALAQVRDILKQRQAMGQEVDTKARTVVERYQAARAELLQGGALLARHEWTKEISDLHTKDNSYFGSIRYLTEIDRAKGLTIPVEG
jgi:hypothetical protein